MPLSDRQQQIMQGIAAGKPNKEIAADLRISQHTVGTHVKAIFSRLGVRSRAQATAFFVKATASA